MLAAGHSYNEISEKLTCTDRYISVWKQRFKQERLAGLDSRYRGAEYRRRTAQTEARILELTRLGPSDGSTHWSSYRLAKELSISQSTVSRVWRQFGLQPHRSRSYMASDDPEFEQKAADIIGLYLKPPVHAAVFALTKRVPSKHLIAWIRFCHSLQGEPNGMASSTIATEPFRSMPPSIPKPERFLLKPAHGTPVRSLSIPSPRSLALNQLAAKSTSLPII